MKRSTGHVVEITTENADYEPLLEPLACFVRSVLDAVSVRAWEVSIVLCDGAAIQVLNRDYRAKDEPTDVLSFAQGGQFNPDGSYTAGDIVVAVPYVCNNAATFNVAPAEELCRVLIHGVLHLAGHDHADNSEHEPMLQLQESLLNGIGVPCLPEPPVVVQKGTGR